MILPDLLGSGWRAISLIHSLSFRYLSLAIAFFVKFIKLKKLATLSVICLLTIGCERRVSEKNTPESPETKTPVPVSTRSPTRSQPEILKSGSFVAGEHPTSGTVRIVSENGKRYLEFGETFKTDSGPDLQVILHRSNNVIASTKPPDYQLKEGDYAIVAPLQKVSGTQRYAVADDIKLENYRSTAVWCRKFNATFGAAAFDKQPNLGARRGNYKFSILFS